MPYKDKGVQKEYQRKWVAQRRADYLADKVCAVCGGTDNLELDHIDPSQKWTHHVWSYCEEKRNAELLKCQILCWTHHNEKTAEQNNMPVAYTHGTNRMFRTHKCRCEECLGWNETILKPRRREQMKRSRLKKKQNKLPSGSSIG